MLRWSARVMKVRSPMSGSEGRADIENGTRQWPLEAGFHPNRK